MELPTFRELLRQELQQDEEARKAALHALIERITAYPDRKMEVKFRIGRREEKIAGGELDDPHHGTSNPSHGIEKPIDTIQVDCRER